jgi:predicted glycoside hydrolase/deacetylase ChbG (UPF0249 family)
VAPTPLIITADDFGLTGATSKAIVEAHLRGIVTATSVLAVARDLDAQLRLLDDAPDLCVGVHLAAVGEDPALLSKAEIPTLVDRAGCFRSSWRVLLRDLLLRRVDPADLRREFGAQIERVSAVRSPTHLDTHQHVHLWPSAATVVVDLAAAHDIGSVRVPRATGNGPKARALNHLARRLASRLDDAGIAHTARFRGLDEAGGWSAGGLESALADLASSGAGSVEINTHPGAETDADRARFAWGYGWDAERRALTDHAVSAAVADHGFVLIGR